MFFSCDQPFLTSDTIKKILKNFNPEIITIPEYDGKRSLPVIFGKNFKNDTKEDYEMLKKGEQDVYSRNNNKQ